MVCGSNGETPPAKSGFTCGPPSPVTSECRKAASAVNDSAGFHSRLARPVKVFCQFQSSRLV